ncbi:MAG: c-type cytochrome [Nitrospinota bacterium]
MCNEAKMHRVLVVGGVVLAALWLASGTAAAQGDAAKGKEMYAKLCASCHGATGKGDGPMAAALTPKLKDLSNKAYLSKLDDKYLVDITAKGGAAIGKAPLMPPFGGSLKEEDIRDVIAYIRSLAE